MTIERLRVILDYSKSHSKGISEDIESFCHQIDVSNLDGIRDVLQIVRPYILRKKYLTIQLPLHDDEIGAFVYKGDSLSYRNKYKYVCTEYKFCTMPRTLSYFFPADEALNKARIDLDYYSNENEIRANEFAENLLMPEIEFKQMFLKLKAIHADKFQTELKLIAQISTYF